jgi:DNA-binding SARP family transcriptional activator
MLRLRTFGGLSLRMDGTPITGVVTQRRQLGLLALLAASDGEGMSRDKLLGYLWPEKDDASARHVLNQLLYSQRQNAGGAGLFLGRKTLRLNPELIDSDVGAFESALAARDPACAVAEYRGPFLDGFFLSEALAFEQWIAERREWYTSRCRAALEELARQALAAEDEEAEVEWRRRVTKLVPLEATAAVVLADALVRRGDRPAAIQALAGHRERVKKELDVDADPSVARMIKRLSGAS